MFGGGRGPMGSGGGMLRAASRAMTRAGVSNGGTQDPFTSSSSSTSSSSNGGYAQKLGGSCSGSNHLTISSSTSGLPLNLPVAATAGAFPFMNSGFIDDFEWVSEGESDSLFGSVPSFDEVDDAVSALKQVFDGDKFENGGGNESSVSYRSDSDWMEPSIQLCHSRILQPHAYYDQVYNAFDLLRTEPSVQRMVMSLSSDKAVWEAVMNNKVVHEIRELYNNGISQEGTDETSLDDIPKKNNAAVNFIKWVFDNTMVKANVVFEKIAKVVTEIFNGHKKFGVKKRKRKDAKSNHWLEEMLRTSVLLSVVVLLVVMVSRATDKS